MNKTTEPEEKSERLSIRIEGMHCASCVATIEGALRKHKGVIGASVSLLDEKAVVEVAPTLVDRETLERVIDSVGYKAKRSAMTIRLAPVPKDKQWDTIKAALTQLGRNRAGSAGVKHHIKAVDRLLGNGHLHREVLEALSR